MTKKIYSQTCIKRSSLQQGKRINAYEIFYDRTRKKWPFNTGDFL